ncbi:dehydratase [Halorientalis sp. IM1011]|uniref:MaoC/PaaZ C-terminal domain-containing protein n=1 Tax=Halorientalis sp. IM1011 TaxID=1932360 RepID=UPI00097CCA24|nr:MaoC/PaaZ C-terminal domain-containing protein [Halorientalis sp. IM1011]AQL43635.1 dehydratase [Halorientalis sp. IM1011]
MPAIAEGEVVTYERTFTESDVREFADLSEDRQPRHLEHDEDGRLMVHGLLTATMPTKIGGDLEVLASHMEFDFRRPVYTGQEVHCRVELTDVAAGEERDEVAADIECTVEGETVLSGAFEGVVLH